MMSASVMALARLLYEFVPQLQGSAPQLLPVILSLLRSKSREVIKSVLGFVKVNFHCKVFIITSTHKRQPSAILLTTDGWVE